MSAAALRRDQVLAWLSRLAVGGLFIAASVHKIADPNAFARSIWRYQILPEAMVNATALILPWLELLAGLALLGVPRLRRGAVLALGGLLLVFTAAIAFNLARGLDIACGCFTSSGGGAHAGAFSLLRNACLLALCWAAWRTAAVLPRKAPSS